MNINDALMKLDSMSRGNTFCFCPEIWRFHGRAPEVIYRASVHVDAHKVLMVNGKHLDLVINELAANIASHYSEGEVTPLADVINQIEYECGMDAPPVPEPPAPVEVEAVAEWPKYAVNDKSGEVWVATAERMLVCSKNDNEIEWFRSGFDSIDELLFDDNVHQIDHSEFAALGLPLIPE